MPKLPEVQMSKKYQTMKKGSELSIIGALCKLFFVSLMIIGLLGVLMVVITVLLAKQGDAMGLAIAVFLLGVLGLCAISLIDYSL